MNLRSALPLVFLTAILSESSIIAQQEPTQEPTPYPSQELQQKPQAPPTRPRPPSGPIEVNSIVAKVNGRVITRNQVNFMLAPVYAQLVAQFPRRGAQFEAQFKETQGNIIQELIDRQIILDEFKQLGASIKPSLIDEEIKRQMRELYNGDEAKFREELKRSRLTMDGYRAMTLDKMVVQAMRAQQFSDAPPPLPNEVQNEYNEMKATLRDMTKDVISFRKIFIPSVDPENPAATAESQLSLAEDLAGQLAAGKDFSELAKSYSKDAFAADGGLQENVPRLDLSPEFAAILFEAPVGKLLGPLLDRQGYTIAISTNIQFGPTPPLDEKIREMVEQRVNKKKTSAQYEKWIENKRKRALIKMQLQN